MYTLCGYVPMRSFRYMYVVTIITIIVFKPDSAFLLLLLQLLLMTRHTLSCWVDTHGCVCVCVCVSVRVRTYTQANTHTHTLTYTHFAHLLVVLTPAH